LPHTVPYLELFRFLVWSYMKSRAYHKWHMRSNASVTRRHK